MEGYEAVLSRRVVSESFIGIVVVSPFNLLYHGEVDKIGYLIKGSSSFTSPFAIM